MGFSENYQDENDQSQDPLKKVREDVFLTPEEAAACLPANASQENREKIRTIGGFTDFVIRLLTEAKTPHTWREAQNLADVESEGAKKIAADIEFLTTHLQKINQGMEKPKDALEDRSDRSWVKRNITNEQVPGLYAAAALFINKGIVGWAKYRMEYIDKHRDEYEHSLDGGEKFSADGGEGGPDGSATTTKPPPKQRVKKNPFSTAYIDPQLEKIPARDETAPLLYHANAALAYYGDEIRQFEAVTQALIKCQDRYDAIAPDIGPGHAPPSQN